MSSQSAITSCTCSVDGYSPECPQAFVQGGEVLHALTRENVLKPRVYGSQETRVVRRDSGNDGRDPITSQEKEEEMILARLAVMEHQPENNGDFRVNTTRPHFKSDVDMMERNRTALRKFEALNIGGQTLTGMTIGGYVVDLSKAAQKASEVAPLPPSKLPIIFQDDEMNFHHHFFQGLEILLGRDVVVGVASAARYYSASDHQIMPLIEKMLKVGYENSDNEITIFAKKVLTSTFETGVVKVNNEEDKTLLVAANLWGFQYIESGMQCREADLRMWLSICYNHYRTIWFNTFKSAGIPAFATEGVQTRYEKKTAPRLVNMEEERNKGSRMFHDLHDEGDSYIQNLQRGGASRISASRRHHKQKQTEGSADTKQRSMRFF